MRITHPSRLVASFAFILLLTACNFGKTEKQPAPAKENPKTAVEGEETPPPVIPEEAGTGILCDSLEGQNASEKLAACFAKLPVEGGTADATAMTGELSLPWDPFKGVQKPVRLLLGPATFRFFETIHLPSRSSVQGAGRDQTLFIQAAGRNLPTALEVVADSSGTASDISLSHFTLDMNVGENQGSGQLFAIRFGLASRITVDSIAVQNYFGLLYDAAQGVSTAVALALGYAQDVLVQNCLFRNLGAIPQATVDDHQSDAIYSSGQRIKILNNEFHGASDTAIVAENASDVLISGNVIYDSTQGIGVSAPVPMMATKNVMVRNNKIYGIQHWNGQGLFVWGVDSAVTPGEKSVSGVQLEDNLVQDSKSGAGVYILGAQDVSLLRVTVSNIRDEKIHNPTLRDGKGILIDQSRRVTVTSSVVDRAQTQGITAQNSSQVTLLDVTVQKSGTSGIVLDHLSDIYLENNRVLDNAQNQAANGVESGIRILETSGPTDTGTLLGNHATGARQKYGLAVLGGKHLKLTSNNFQYNFTNPGLLIAPGLAVEQQGNLISP